MAAVIIIMTPVMTMTLHVATAFMRASAGTTTRTREHAGGKECDHYQHENYQCRFQQSVRPRLPERFFIISIFSLQHYF